MSAEHAGVERVIARVKSVYGRWRRDTTPAQMRSDWDDLFSARGDAAVSDVVANGVPCRWHTASGARPDRVVLYFHGGGFQVGSLDSHREIMSLVSGYSGARVLGVGYRLAPEHRYPAAHEDAMAVFEWLRAQGIDARHIALAGDSAGGGLALSLALALEERGRALPAACYAMSAWTDLTASGESYETRASMDPIHQKPMIVAMARNYLGPAREASDPRVSPLMAAPARLSKLPPLLLQVGERETVVSDSEAFARKVREAGGKAEVQVWPGMIHVFQQFPSELREAHDALAQGATFLAARLGMQPPTESSQ
ncbi:MAG TPA: alpha/beta hydrolase [Ramlibacter sp.]|uniref:alpha/beta hydrolase n=1 Tax=Ramlibacter sp. TaxID=1917967 RepID=UPI002C9D526A|nr:alpha/beta hydrolase [Ramlibacter sp.]HVZ44199.1 alpha/beta hydrolase [Ramlibacter sp.]